MVNNERKLAWVASIEDIQPIEGADLIELAVVGGWKCVVKKGEYNIGDSVIYISIDSWVPNTLAPFLTSPSHFPKVYNGVEGERLRTKKLRGVYSQGLILPLNTLIFPEGSFDGNDVTYELGIQLWEKPIPACLAGQVKGNFPSFLRKTKCERIQNSRKDFDKWKASNIEFTVTEKLDGTSATFYLKDDVFGVCSRNLELKEEENNTYWKTAKNYDIEDALRNCGKDLCIQGEIVGTGIQDNIYKLNAQNLFVFSIFDIYESKYWDFKDVQEFCLRNGLTTVPYLDTITLENHTIESLLEYSDSERSKVSDCLREGVVLFSGLTQENVKVISNKFLCKYDS